MRFHADGPAIPDILLERCDAGRVVFLCGAGVSQPSGMPSFIDLTRYVIEFFDPPQYSEIMTAFQPWLEDASGANVPLDQIFNLLHLEYGRDEVNALVTKRLSSSLAIEGAGREHALIRRISSSQSGVPQIVTTNFDLLFESGADSEEIIYHIPPAFPDLAFGATIEGITYLHGRLADAGAIHHQYVLSSSDFGRAYLSEGWATSFIRGLLSRYTVVLVGYKAEDPPIKYLLQGLSRDGLYDRSRLFAFDRGTPEDIQAKWLDRGVSAIAYADHAHLWKTMEAWADRADDPRRWRASVIAVSPQDPKSMAPYQRGQVAHILRSVQGARLFAEADPVPHPEWVCVLDARVRSAEQSKGYGEDAELFDPRLAYGLDDDIEITSAEDRRKGVSNDNLLVWRAGDDNPHEFHRLGERVPHGSEAVPPRLGHLIAWVRKSIESPVLAWWAIRQYGLHPRLLQQIDWQVSRSANLHKRARHVWNLVLESLREHPNQQWEMAWFDLKDKITGEGWTPSALRYFRVAFSPKLVVSSPLGLGRSRPPAASWDDIQLSDLGQFEVEFPRRHNEKLEVPDEVLPEVLRVLEDQLIVAAGLLTDVGTFNFRTPTYYPKREIDGEVHAAKAADILSSLLEIFDRIVDLAPRLAAAHAMAWPETDRYFFRKLKLYAFSKGQAFDADNVAEAILSFDQEAFWDQNVVRELLFLLVDRWGEFSQEFRNRLVERILAGPSQLSHWSDEDYPDIRNEFAARYGRYIELQGCIFSVDHTTRLADTIETISGWSDGWATSIVTEHGTHSGWVRTDETPDAVLSLPVSEIVAGAEDAAGHDFGSFTEKRPFIGLVKANPAKALSALTVAGKKGRYPQALWSSMISDLPEDISPRLKRVFLLRLVRLPHSAIVALRYTLARWLQQSLAAVLEFDDGLAWAVYDHFIDGIVSGGADATASSIGEIRQGGVIVERSRRTLDHAVNSPVGMCAEALFSAVPGEKQEPGSLIPAYIQTRVERLLSTPGDGPDHAVSIAMRKLNWLMHVDPAWTQECFIPMLAFNHLRSEAAWNGFLHAGRVPWKSLAEITKPLLVELFPWIYGFSWDRELPSVAANWLGFMRIFRSDQPSGLTKREMRSALRSMSGETRNQFIYWLGAVGRENENGWIKHVVPFINEVWPRERKFLTSASTRAWIGLLDDTGDSFPTMYKAVKRFLLPIEADDRPFYRFTRDLEGEAPITARFPGETLDLVHTVTPNTLARPPYELSKILALVGEVAPELLSDPRYLRLMDLVERS